MARHKGREVTAPNMQAPGPSLHGEYSLAITEAQAANVILWPHATGGVAIDVELTRPGLARGMRLKIVPGYREARAWIASHAAAIASVRAWIEGTLATGASYTACPKHIAEALK